MDEKWTIEKNGVTFKAHTEMDDVSGTEDLGKYTDKFQPWCIDRKTGKMYGELVEQTMTEDEYTKWIFEHQKYLNYADSNDDGTLTVSYWPVVAESSVARWQFNTFQYFIPTNCTPYNPQDWAHVSKKDIRGTIKKYGSLEKAHFAYALQDYERAERFTYDWNYVGLVVKMVVEGTVIDEASLWGVESDSDDDYFQEVTDDLISEMLGRTAQTEKRHRCIVKVLKDLRKEKA